MIREYNSGDVQKLYFKGQIDEMRLKPSLKTINIARVFDQQHKTYAVIENSGIYLTVNLLGAHQNHGLVARG